MRVRCTWLHNNALSYSTQSQIVIHHLLPSSSLPPPLKKTLPTDPNYFWHVTGKTTIFFCLTPFKNVPCTVLYCNVYYTMYIAISMSVPHINKANIAHLYICPFKGQLTIIIILRGLKKQIWKSLIFIIQCSDDSSDDDDEDECEHDDEVPMMDMSREEVSFLFFLVSKFIYFINNYFFLFLELCLKEKKTIK